jgi:hypothetical protein
MPVIGCTMAILSSAPIRPVANAADDLDVALSGVVAMLRPATGRDWSVSAGGLEWDGWHTEEHIGDCLLSYAGQLVVQPDGFMANADEDASPDEVLEFVEMGGRILVATVRTAAPDVRLMSPSFPVMDAVVPAQADDAGSASP